MSYRSRVNLNKDVISGILYLAEIDLIQCNVKNRDVILSNLKEDLNKKYIQVWLGADGLLYKHPYFNDYLY